MSLAVHARQTARLRGECVVAGRRRGTRDADQGALTRDQGSRDYADIGPSPSDAVPSGPLLSGGSTRREFARGGSAVPCRNAR